ncbi:amino acid--tRNA ligase-related protein [Cobetia marina]
MQRARLINEVRAFFAEREVLEVETPVLGQAGSTDVGLASLSSSLQLPGERERVSMWLQTSPEFHMKRLLAAGSGPIFQIALPSAMVRSVVATIPSSACWSGIAPV